VEESVNLVTKVSNLGLGWTPEKLVNLMTRVCNLELGWTPEELVNLMTKVRNNGGSPHSIDRATNR
jgi:hypothetical protein